jgi:hypothetical protein
MGHTEKMARSGLNVLWRLRHNTGKNFVFYSGHGLLSFHIPAKVESGSFALARRSEK